jgi:hypothetical protein
VSGFSGLRGMRPLTSRKRAGGGGAVPINDTITLTRGLYGWGSSSWEGNSDGSGVSSTSDLATQIDAAAVASTESISSVNYPIYTLSNGQILHNRGVGSQTDAQIDTRVTADMAAVGASAFCFLHIGDNGHTAGDAAGVTSIKGHMDNMVAQAGARPYLTIVNTRGSYASASRLSASEMPGTYFYTLKEVLFRQLSAAYPGKVLDLYHNLLDHAADYGLPDPTNDQADIDKGMSPMSFMKSDGSHMDQDGQKVTARYALKRVIAAVEGKVPYGLRQFIAAQQPATPAAGDTIGTINFYGSGGSLSLAAANTQTDYAVSSAGVITRIGATPPSRDLTQVKVQFAKSGNTPVVQPNIWVGEKAKSGVSRLVEFDGYGVLTQLVSPYTNQSAILIAFRLQGATGSDGVSQELFKATSGLQLTKNANDALDVVIRNAAAQSIMSATSATDSFEAADAAQWVIISLDVPTAVAKFTRFLTPTTGVTTTANGGAAQTQLASDATQKVFMTNQHGFGIGGAGMSFSQLGSKRGSFRMGDFWMACATGVYRDPALQATRELFAEADGSPKASLLASSDGVVDGITPLLYCRGNATDWRMCNFLGSAVNEWAFHNWKNPNTGEPGYLTTI